MSDEGLTHKHCGGAIEPDTSKTYHHWVGSNEGAGEFEDVPALRCVRCGVEILGDAQIVPESLAISYATVEELAEYSR